MGQTLMRPAPTEVFASAVRTVPRFLKCFLISNLGQDSQANLIRTCCSTQWQPRRRACHLAVITRHMARLNLTSGPETRLAGDRVCRSANDKDGYGTNLRVVVLAG